MAVLRHGGLQVGPAPRCDHLISFAAFEQVMENCARILKRGGFLAVAFSNFRFADTAVAGRFEAVMQLTADAADPGTPLYGRDDCLLPGASYGDIVFRKHGSSGRGDADRPPTSA